MSMTLTTYEIILGIIDDYSNMVNRNKKRLRKYLGNLEVRDRAIMYDNPYIDYKSKDGIRIFSYRLSDRLVVTSGILDDNYEYLDDKDYYSLVKDIISELYKLDINDVG
jgi:hypothetical protein